LFRRMKYTSKIPIPTLTYPDDDPRATGNARGRDRAPANARGAADRSAAKRRRCDGGGAHICVSLFVVARWIVSFWFFLDLGCLEEMEADALEVLGVQRRERMVPFPLGKKRALNWFF
jgi:hypothetical protein